MDDETQQEVAGIVRAAARSIVRRQSTTVQQYAPAWYHLGENAFQEALRVEIERLTATAPTPLTWRPVSHTLSQPSLWALTPVATAGEPGTEITSASHIIGVPWTVSSDVALQAHLVGEAVTAIDPATAQTVVQYTQYLAVHRRRLRRQLLERASQEPDDALCGTVQDLLRERTPTMENVLAAAELLGRWIDFRLRSKSEG